MNAESLIHCPTCDLDHPGPTNPCILCLAYEEERAERSQQVDDEMAAEAEVLP